MLATILFTVRSEGSSAMSNVLEGLSTWFSERPQWLQIVALQLCQKSEVTEIDATEFSELCLREAAGELLKVPREFPGLTEHQNFTGSLRLCSISNVEGINALAPTKPLEFGNKNISIVYGNNGSGKSGYIRLLKHVCGARDIGKLLCNVYKQNSALQQATILFKEDNTVQKCQWTGQGVCDELRNVDIFDTSFGKVFASSEEEASYEPPLLSFFSLLTLVCEKVAAALDTKADKIATKRISIPFDIKRTPEAIWYESINSRTTIQDIDKYCTFGSNEESVMQIDEKRLVEKDPYEVARMLTKKKQYMDFIIEEAQKIFEQLSDKNCRSIIEAKKIAVLKKSVADTAAGKAFSNSQFEGIGSDIWKELWKAAENYSVSFGYKDIEYPNLSEDARCILCHQILGQEAKDRLFSFENFVKGETQEAAKDAENKYKIACESVSELPVEESLKARIDAAGIPEELSKKIHLFYSQLKKRKEELFGIGYKEDAIQHQPSEQWIEEARVYSAGLEAEIKQCDEDAKSNNRDKIRAQLNSLQTKKWLSANRESIVEEVERFKQLNRIAEAKRLTNTKALSQKKGELAEVLITDEFVQRFNDELKKLGAYRLRVELVKAKVVKGRVLHKLQLRGAASSCLTEVLSEGENRIVSIAAFLADVTGKNKTAPIIFDDPISSLDQNYEEAVVQRLIDLSNTNQIIIFTHRLSLLGNFRHFVQKSDEMINVVNIRNTSWGTGEPTDMPLSKSGIKKALNILIEQRCKEVRDANIRGDFELVEKSTKSICSDFRMIIERSIEDELLCGVVQRFQRSIASLKLKNLIKMNSRDCQFLDSLMTKYSAFEHSQPAELPIDLPDIDDLLSDMMGLRTWRKEYENRVVKP